MGLIFKLEKNKIEIYESGKLKPITLKTSAYPGFPTDMQAQIVTLGLFIYRKFRSTGKYI